ncbi:hypothetical protein [Frondihabitans cladoniiphilus]|uniref:Very-short-patch-repair endonuclease n=1 Tax=Frondihabitans cladoniiphilus TaxID=715785 RepID=A0ABP8W5F5_9MICO
MATIGSWVDAAGGVLHKRRLVALGARDRDLTRAVRSGEVRRARRGWYTTLSQADPRFVALRVGGRLTGVAALEQLAAWLPRRRMQMTVSVPRNAARLRGPDGVRVVYDGIDVLARGDLTVVAPKDALPRALLELEFDEAVTLLDWARRSDWFDESDVAEVMSKLPADARGVLEWSNPTSESFIESLARVRSELDGRRVVTQVPVGRRQFFDLEVDGVVAIEVDGREFHADSFEADRRKDLAIILEGRFPIRLTYDMVVHQWQRVAEAVDRALAMHHDGGSPPPRRRRLPRRRGSRPWLLPACTL